MQPLKLDRPAGVFAAVLTPFDHTGAPDSAMLALHCRWLLANGCDGLSILGTTGEGNSLSVDSASPSSSAWFPTASPRRCCCPAQVAAPFPTRSG